MISQTMNELLLQSIFIEIFLTATAIGFVEENRCLDECPNSTVACTDRQRPGDCDIGIPCCRIIERGRDDITICKKNSFCCPYSHLRCNSSSDGDSSSDDFCSNRGICCQDNRQSSETVCVCFGGFYGVHCHRRNYEKFIVTENIPPISTKQQDNSRDYTTQETPRGSSEQSSATSIALTTFVAVIAVGVLLCIASVVITRLIFKRKNGSVETGIKSGNTDAEKKYQNLKTSRLNEDGEIANHYDTIELYDKGYDTIHEYSLEDPNYEGILDSEYLDVIAEADDGNLKEADDNDYAATEDHQSRQTEANNDYEAFLEQETPSIQ